MGKENEEPSLVIVMDLPTSNIQLWLIQSSTWDLRIFVSFCYQCSAELSTPQVGDCLASQYLISLMLMILSIAAAAWLSSRTGCWFRQTSLPACTFAIHQGSAVIFWVCTFWPSCFSLPDAEYILMMHQSHDGENQWPPNPAGSLVTVPIKLST